MFKDTIMEKPDGTKNNQMAESSKKDGTFNTCTVSLESNDQKSEQRLVTIRNLETEPRPRVERPAPPPPDALDG